MTDDEQRVSTAELLRLFQSIVQQLAEMRAEMKADRHTFANQLQAIFVQHEETRTRVRGTEDDVAALQADVKAVRRDAAILSGGISATAFLAQFWPWRH